MTRAETVGFFGGVLPENLDVAQLRRAIDHAPVEELLEALLRRSKRAADLARAAYHQADHELEPARMADLIRRVEASATKCRSYSSALRALAPGSPQDQWAFDIALEVASLAVVIAPRKVDLDHHHERIDGACPRCRAERKTEGHA